MGIKIIKHRALYSKYRNTIKLFVVILILIFSFNVIIVEIVRAKVVLSNSIISLKIINTFIFLIKNCFDMIGTYQFCTQFVNSDYGLQDKLPFSIVCGLALFA